MRRVFTFVFIVAAFCNVMAYYIPLYRFDHETGNWQRDFYSLNPYPGFSIDSKKTHDSVSFVTESLFSLSSSISPEHAKSAPIYAGKDGKVIGQLLVWNDQSNLFLEFNLTDNWLMEESHVNCSIDPPNSNPVPGSFTYKTTHDPNIDYFLYKIPLISPLHEWPVDTELYILAHATVKKVVGGQVVGKEETAWGGDIEWDGGGKWFWYLKYRIEEPPSYICVDLSGTLLSWFVRKPGDYFANPITGNIRASHDFVITFSGFDNLQHSVIQGERVDVFYGFGDDVPVDSEWIGATELNTRKVDMPATEGTQWKIWQRIEVLGQIPGTYSNRGVITFTLKNSQIQVVK
jgi:hypothetical protein